MVQQRLAEAFEQLHDRSLPSIELLQKSFPHSDSFMISISTFFDPRYVFLIYAPVLFALNKRVAHRMVVALSLTEWLNQILKWLLAGERPYWYVHERAHELHQLGAGSPVALNLTGIHSYDASLASVHFGQSQFQSQSAPLRPAPVAELRQFPVTCELGAGSPSGHAMVTATVWYILLDAWQRNQLSLFARPANASAGTSTSAHSGAKAGEQLARLGWSAYAISLLLVSLSRVYLACHFPHQCLCGALLGLLLARLVAERLPETRLRRRHFAALTALMFLSVMATYGLLRALGLNPLWSVSKAMRWCANKDHIHLDTTPFFSMMRYLGMALGAGLAYEGARLEGTRPANEGAHEGWRAAHLFARRCLTGLASVAFGQALLAVPMPRANLQLFYLISMLTYALFAYSIAGPIPRLVKRLYPASCSGGAERKCA